MSVLISIKANLIRMASQIRCLAMLEMEARNQEGLHLSFQRWRLGTRKVLDCRSIDFGEDNPGITSMCTRYVIDFYQQYHKAISWHHMIHGGETYVV